MKASKTRTPFRNHPEPIKVADLELSEPISALSSVADNGRRYGAALLLARVHGEPVAQVKLEPGPDADGWSADEVRRLVLAEAGRATAAHLDSDGSAGDDSGAGGAGGAGADAAGTGPRCEQERARFLATAPALSVVIPTRGRPQRLAECVRDILGGSYPGDRLTVFVVDNVPTDDSVRRVVEKLAAEGDVRYLREDTPGSASARNRALPEVQTEHVLFTDDDSAVDGNWAAQTVQAFGAAPEVGVVTGLVVPRELDTPAQVWFEEYGGFSRGFARRVFDLTENVPDDRLYPYTAGVFGTGNNMAFRTEVLREIGAFDPALGNGTPALGGVDSEALFRAVVLGHRLVYEPTSFVRHSHRADYYALRRQIRAYGAGQSAYLLKMMIGQPRLVPGLARRVPRGLAFAFGKDGAKNAHKSSTYPRQLTFDEIRGLAFGPIGYARSRRRYGAHQVGPVRPGTPTPR